MARGRSETTTHLNFELWLTFDFFGPVRVTKQEPDLNRNERSMFVKVALPKALFNIPTLNATINVAEGQPLQLDIAVAADALKQALGVDVDLVVKPLDDNRSVD
jgi:hypothetical protein